MRNPSQLTRPVAVMAIIVASLLSAAESTAAVRFILISSLDDAGGSGREFAGAGTVELDDIRTLDVQVTLRRIERKQRSSSRSHQP